MSDETKLADAIAEMRHITKIVDGTDMIDRAPAADDLRAALDAGPNYWRVRAQIAEQGASRSYAQQEELRKQLLNERGLRLQAQNEAQNIRATIGRAADDLRTENERLRGVLAMIAEQAEQPEYRNLEVGFRHSPLSPAERCERLAETCLFIAQDARAALRDTQGGE